MPAIVNKTKKNEKEFKDNLYTIQEEDVVYSTEDMVASFTKMRKAINDGDITEDGLKKLASEYDIDVNLLLDFAKMDRLQQEQDVRFKSDLSNVENTFHSYPTTEGQVEEFAGVKLTGNSDGTVHCESDYLGTFDYDPAYWGVFTKDVTDENGKTVSLPVFVYEGPGDGDGVDAENVIGDAADSLAESAYDDWNEGGFFNTISAGAKYIGAGVTNLAAIPGDAINYAITGGDDKYGGKVEVPDGVKNMDYTFANRDDLAYYPAIPDSVESMHCTFENCESMTEQQVFHNNQKLELPKNLKDMSCTFKNCKSLQGAFSGSDIYPTYDSETGKYVYDDKEYANMEDWKQHMEETWRESHDGEEIDWKAYYNEHASVGWCHIPESVENLTECWNGCESLTKPKNEGIHWYNFLGMGDTGRASHAVKMGEYVEGKKYELPVFGGRITPYLDAAFAKDVLAGISGKDDAEFVKQYADSQEYTMKNGVVNKKYKDIVDSLDQDKVKDIRSSALMARHGSNLRGDISSMADLASGGNRSDNIIWTKDENGNYVLKNDSTGLRNSEHFVSGKDTWGSFINYAISMVAIGGITKKATDSKVAGVAAGVGGTLLLSNVFPKLYESFLPVCEWVHDVLPNGSIKDKLRNFIDEKSPNARRARENEFINEHNKLWDDPYNVAAAFLTGKDPTGADLAYTGGLEYEEDGHKKKATGGNYTAGGKRTNVINPLTDIFSRTTEMVPYYNPEILNTLMKNSGQACATSPIFMVMGSYKDNTSGEYTNLAKPVTECISEACKAREEIWAQSETGPNTTDMKEYYLNLMSALETYNKEGKNALGQIYSAGGLEYKLSTQGLIDVNKAFTDEAMKSLMKMDMKRLGISSNLWISKALILPMLRLIRYLMKTFRL